MKAQAYSRSRNGGKYHIKHNNCQHFIVDLQRRITTITDLFEPREYTPVNVHGAVTYTPESPVSPPLSRHDSVASTSETVLKIRDSTFAPLMAAAMEMHARKGIVKGAGAVNVVTTEVVALS